MTAFGEVETAVGAMRAGARDYLTKPVNVGELSRRGRARAGSSGGFAPRRACCGRGCREKYSFDNIIGSAAPMQEVFKTVAQIAPSRASVLITGESGTGKELIAAAIHERSPRATGPFVKLHCAALAESLLESELFGHERGSFTGAAGPSRRPLPAGQRRHAVPRRDRRDLAGRPGEAAALPAGARVRARGRQRDHQRRRAGDRRDQPRPAADGRGGQVPRGPLLPAQRHQPGDAAAARAPVRHPAAGRALPAQVRRRERQGDRGLLGRGAGAPGRLRLAGQRARARERRRARGRARADGAGHASPSCRPSWSPAKARGGLQIPGATMDEIERYAITKTLESTGGSTSRAAEILDISVRKIQYKLHEYESAPKSARPPVRRRRTTNDHRRRLHDPRAAHHRARAVPRAPPSR